MKFEKRLDYIKNTLFKVINKNVDKLLTSCKKEAKYLIKA
jgi:hypothetical protein